MKGNKTLIFILTLILVMATTTVGVANIDYSQWNSTSKYPSDIAGTQLLTQARAYIDKGIITGDTDGLFHPERNITRAEYATIMAKATSNTGRISTAEKQTYFNDMSGYNWAKGYINACYEAGLINGVGNSKYNPGGSVTYVEVVAVILRSKGITDATVNRYGTWPNNYIKYAELYNMDGALNVTNWRAPASKGDVVQLLYRNMPKSTISAATVTVTSVPAVPVSTGAVTFTATASGSGTHQYQWYYEGAAIAGATASTYSTVGTTSVGAFFVRVTTSQTGYNDATSDSNVINVI